MTKKYITPEGKEKLLKLGFLGEEAGFRYMALGNGNSAITENPKDFNEVINKGSYERVEIKLDESFNEEGSICISGTFDGSNYNLSDGGIITEIAIVDSALHTDTETFFCLVEVPEIIKTDNTSLKYSLVISLL